MNTKDSGSGGVGFQLSFTAILALLTVVGSVLMVSQRLSSQRPMASAGKAQSGADAHAVDTRSWEDPFSPQAKRGEPQRAVGLTNGMAELRAQIGSRRREGETVLLLPVMVPGIAYSEERDTTLRRLATNAAAFTNFLLPAPQPAVAPAPATPIPAVLEIAMTMVAGWAAKVAAVTTNVVPAHTNLASAQVSAERDIRPVWISFEWYRQWTFHPRNTS